MESNQEQIQQAAQFIFNADKILIGSGAGFGKDSGLPDYRGDQGFWNNYPPYRGKVNFLECANPHFFRKQPSLFWGFYGSRLKLYRDANPHKGFDMLLNLNKNFGKQVFSVTSNVDGQFQKAGYHPDQIYQIHGSIHYNQCDICRQIKPTDFDVQVDYTTMTCQKPPKCKNCDSIIRPNIWMFDDNEWISQRGDKQGQNYKRFINQKKSPQQKICLIQIGAGTAIPTIRQMLGQQFTHNKNARYIRINPEKQDNSLMDPFKFVHLQLGSLNALSQIYQILQKKK